VVAAGWSISAEKLQSDFWLVAGELLPWLRYKTLLAKAFKPVRCKVVAPIVAFSMSEVAWLRAIENATLQLLQIEVIIAALSQFFRLGRKIPLLK
jgi:hypothetical protein